jgi:hypothetical protein
MIFTTEQAARKLTGLSYLGSVNSSAKIEKNGKMGVLTYIIYLAPAFLSGRNVCPMHTKHCAKSCLAFSGRAKFFKDLITNARIKKTDLFFDEREFFSQWCVAEITRYKKYAEKKGMEFSIRLNGTSDINPETIKVNGKNILQLFPDVQFYDYTKVFNRIRLTEKYPNYNLTYSYSGDNWLNCEIALMQNVNVSAVFEQVPATFRGFKVVNGDESDVRYKDEKGVIVGLKYKKTSNDKTIDFSKNIFVIKKENCIFEKEKELTI